MTTTLRRNMADLPLIAILRGIGLDETLAVGELLIARGFRILEVPMNSPEPIESIRLLTKNFGTQALVGAGTVLTIEQVNAIADAGGRLIVSPNMNPAVIAASKRLDLVSIPGIFTASEAFTALETGADGLKLFPAEAASPQVVKALRAVLPAETMIFPVGGIDPYNMAAYLKAGATGFGIGSALYKAGKDHGDIDTDAADLVQAYRRAAA